MNNNYFEKITNMIFNNTSVVNYLKNIYKILEHYIKIDIEKLLPNSYQKKRISYDKLFRKITRNTILFFSTNDFINLIKKNIYANMNDNLKYLFDELLNYNVYDIIEKSYFGFDNNEKNNNETVIINNFIFLINRFFELIKKIENNNNLDMKILFEGIKISELNTNLYDFFCDNIKFLKDYGIQFNYEDTSIISTYEMIPLVRIKEISPHFFDLYSKYKLLGNNFSEKRQIMLVIADVYYPIFNKYIHSDSDDFIFFMNKFFKIENLDNQENCRAKVSNITKVFHCWFRHLNKNNRKENKVEKELNKLWEDKNEFEKIREMDAYCNMLASIIFYLSSCGLSYIVKKYDECIEGSSKNEE